MKKLDKTAMSEVEKAHVRNSVNGGLPVDKLKAIFEMQAELDKFIIEKHSDKTPKSVSEWVIATTLAMESEIDEVRREVNWKFWKPEKEIDVEKLHEEVIDLWHFLVQLSQRVGLSPDKVFEVYTIKREENFARQQGQSKDGEAYDYSEGGQQ